MKGSETRSYRIATSGHSDTVMLLFEVTQSGNRQIAADDDSGTDANALIDARLQRGCSYQVGVRLYHAAAESETSLMIS